MKKFMKQSDIVCHGA